MQGPRGAVIAIAAAASAALAIGLGFWQLDRGAEKSARQEALESRQALAPLSAAELAREPGAAVASQRFRRAVVTGRFIADRTVFLDNRQMGARVGFVVCTPLVLAGSGEAVLVQRGFVPRRFDDRTALPPITTPAGPVRIAGRVDGSPARLYEFGTDAAGPIRQNLDLGAFATETGLALLPVSIVQDDAEGASAGDGLSRRWNRPAADVQKHHGYAFQWFMIAAAITSLYVWYRFIAPKRARR